MIVLDTDHISILQHTGNSAAQTLSQRLAESADRDIATTVVTVEEQMRSWLSLIARYRDAEQQATYYEQLIRFVRFFNTWRILSLDRTAISELTRLRKSKVRVASTDLKIAAITLSRGGLLLSRNLDDFRKIPGLRVEERHLAIDRFRAAQRPRGLPMRIGRWDPCAGT